MYIPAAFAETNLDRLEAFIEANSFATLISVIDGIPFASHLPMLLDRPRGLLLGHLAKANPHWRGLGGAESLVLFTGPHGFISPDWYTSTPAVPTWNYTAIHVYGQARAIVEETALAKIVDRLVQKYETSPRWVEVMSADYKNGLLKAIVGVEVQLERIEGKFKLSQNRSIPDRLGVIAELERGNEASRELAAMMRDSLG